MVTQKGSMSTEGETLQVFVLPYRCSICPPLVTSITWQTFLAHAWQSRPMAPPGLFVSQRTGSHSAGISCTTHELFWPLLAVWGTWSETCVAPSQLTQFLQIKTQNALLFPVHAMFLHDCPLAVKPASMPRRLIHQNKTKILERFSTYWYAPFCCACLGCCAAEFRSSGETCGMNYPVFTIPLPMFPDILHGLSWNRTLSCTLTVAKICLAITVKCIKYKPF
jgi:hypothetical protein